MRNISTAEFDRMKETSEQSMNDVCTIHVPTITQDTYGGELRSFSDTSNVVCGFAYGKADISYRGQNALIEADGILRLSLSQAIDDKSEITVRGTRYSINGIKTGKTVKVITLKRVVADE